MFKMLKNISQLDGFYSIMQLKKIYEGFLQLSWKGGGIWKIWLIWSYINENQKLHASL